MSVLSYYLYMASCVCVCVCVTALGEVDENRTMPGLFMKVGY